MGTDATCEDGGTVGPLSVQGWRRVCFRVHFSGLVFGEGVDAALEGYVRDARGMRAAIEVMVYSFGSPQEWRRWPLFFSRCDTDMATDAAGSTSVPLCWG